MTIQNENNRSLNLNKGDEMKRKSLTVDQLKLLAVTTDDKLLEVFPGYTRRFLRETKKNLPALVDIHNDRVMEKTKNKMKYDQAKYKEALTTIEVLENKLTVFDDLKANKKKIKIIPKKAEGKSEAVAVIVASDWHIDERIDPDTVNGLNEYDDKVAEKRANNFFVNAVKLVKKEQQGISISTIVLALIGDFFSGKIHEELKENRTMLINSAILKTQELLAGGIEYILNNTNCDIIIPCSSGN